MLKLTYLPLGPSWSWPIYHLVLGVCQPFFSNKGRIAYMLSRSCYIWHQHLHQPIWMWLNEHGQPFLGMMNNDEAVLCTSWRSDCCICKYSVCFLYLYLLINVVLDDKIEATLCSCGPRSKYKVMWIFSFRLKSH